MTVYHVEMKKYGDTYQFVSGDIGEKALLKWVYETMSHNVGASMTIYYPTQIAGRNFKLYNEIGKVRQNNGIKFYRAIGGTFYITPKGDLSDTDPNARRL